MKLVVEVNGYDVEFYIKPNHMTSDGKMYCLEGNVAITDTVLKLPQERYEEVITIELEGLTNDMRKALLEFKKQNDL